MGCCGGGSGQTLKSPPAREPYKECGGKVKTFAPDAWVILNKFGIDPCSVPGTGQDGLVTRMDAERAKLRR